MRKHLLLPLLIALVVSAFGQDKFSKITGPYKDLKLNEVKSHPDQMSNTTTGVYKQTILDAQDIGTTWYDAQSINYGNMMQRIWAYDDGTVGATWTGMGSGTPGVPERGCGYNYFDGSSWGDQNPHVGPSDRMGTPSYAPWGETGEIMAQYRYVANAGPIYIYKRAIKGEGDWEEVELSGPSGVSLVWHSLTTSGENYEHIHLLALTYDAEYMGQENALLYYRSSDGGTTWDINGQIIDGLGVDYYKSINNLSYAWSNSVGNTIAFTYGFDEFGGQIFKSDDNGDSWDIIDVFTTPFSGENPPTDTEIFPCGIGTSAIALDSDGMAHVVFPRMRKQYAAGEWSWFPYTDGLIYWNETMDVLDTTIISSYTLDYLDEGGYLIGWIEDAIEIQEGQPNYANGLWGYPQLSIDADNNIFVATTTISDYDNGVYYYRHIFANSSFNSGVSWEGQVDLNDDNLYMFSECAYPAMAPIVDDMIHIVYQEDYIPGIHEWLEDHDAEENRMVALSYNKDFFVGAGEQYEETSIKLSDGYPIPADNNVNFNLSLDEKYDVSISLTNIVGQVVKSEKLGQHQIGTNRISLDVSELITGTYFCTIEIDNQKLTRKVIITR